MVPNVRFIIIDGDVNSSTAYALLPGNFKKLAELLFPTTYTNFDSSWFTVGPT